MIHTLSQHAGLNDLVFSAGMEPLRSILGAGANTLLAPTDLADWDPPTQARGWIDKKPVIDLEESPTTEVK